MLSMLGQAELARVLFPVGEMTKAEVRAHAAGLGLRTAAKPDSQDVCFIGSAEGRQGFLAERLELHPAEVVDGAGRDGGDGRRGRAGDRGPAPGHGPRRRRRGAATWWPSTCRPAG